MKNLIQVFICWVIRLPPLEMFGDHYWRKKADGPFTTTRYTPLRSKEGWVELGVKHTDGYDTVSLPIRKFYRTFRLYTY